MCTNFMTATVHTAGASRLLLTIIHRGICHPSPPVPPPLITQVRIGICAMDKKARSKPMKEIVSRLLAYGEFEMVYFGDEVGALLGWPKAGWRCHVAEPLHC